MGRPRGLGVVASFGVALTSPLSRTLNTLTAGASVGVGVEAADGLVCGRSARHEAPRGAALAYLTRARH
mgnify:CR=1 FL=1